MKFVPFAISVFALGLSTGNVFATELPSWDSGAEGQEAAREAVTAKWTDTPVHIRSGCLETVAKGGEETWIKLDQCLRGRHLVKLFTAPVEEVNEETPDQSGRITELEAALQESQERENGMSEVLQTMRINLDDSDARISELRKEMSASKQTIRTLRAELSEARTTITSLEEQANAIKAPVATTNAASGLDALKQTIRERDAEISSLKSDASKTEDRISALQDAIDQQQVQIAEYKSAAKDADQAAESLQNDVQNEQETITTAEGEQSEQLAELEKKIASLNTLLVQRNRANNALSAQNASLKDARSGGNEDMSASSEELTAANDTIAQQREEIASLKRRVRAAQKRAEEAETSLRFAVAPPASSSALSIVETGPITVATLAAPMDMTPPEPLQMSDSVQCAAEIARMSQDGVTFRSGSAKLNPSALPILNSVAMTLQACPDGKFTVEGHTDSRGSREMNVDLSRRRAQSVVHYLVSRGVQAYRLQSSGFGPDQPIANNASEQGRARNRRIEFVLK